MTGAPMFVSHAAMRAGAGIVWCGVPGRAAAAVASGTEVITVALPATRDGGLDEPRPVPCSATSIGSARSCVGSRARPRRAHPDRGAPARRRRRRSRSCSTPTG